MIAAKYHLHSPNVLPTILYEREGPMSSNIERSHNNDTDETIPKLVAMDNHIGSEETIPKRVYSSIDDLPVGMTAEHYQHIDVNVIVSHDAGQKTTDMKTNNHSSLDAYGSVIVDDDAGKPNKFINGNASTCSEGSAENRSRRSDGTFSAGVDEVRVFKLRKSSYNLHVYFANGLFLIYSKVLKSSRRVFNYCFIL